MQKQQSTRRTIVFLGLGSWLLSACGGVQIGGDALVQHLPPGRDQVCRAAVRDALAERNVTAEWIERVRYSAVRSGSRVTGFEAWVTPNEGGGNLVVELSMECRVTRIWARGMR